MLGRHKDSFFAVVTGCECKLPRHSRDRHGRPLLTKPSYFLRKQLPADVAASAQIIFIDDSCEKIEENEDAIRLSLPNPFVAGMTNIELMRDTDGLVKYIAQGMSMCKLAHWGEYIEEQHALPKSREAARAAREAASELGCAASELCNATRG